MQRRGKSDHTKSPSRHFLFCTGIENSYPVITDRAGKSLRRDGMELSRHYHHWKQDLRLVKEMGIDCLRYGPPYYKTHLGPMKYNWSFADETFGRMRALGIWPIADLCHFGVPDWIGDFQNPQWPALFAAYAAAFTKRFRWVRFYTPVNEIFVCARFSAQLGWWNERLQSDRAFVTALKNMCRATILAEEEILKVRPDAIFVQSESSQYFHAGSPGARAHADFLNQKRFLSLDLCYGHDAGGLMHEYLLDNGMSRGEYHWFLEHGRAIRWHCVMGTDYYVTNEYRVSDPPQPPKPEGGAGDKSPKPKSKPPPRGPLEGNFKVPGLSGEVGGGKPGLEHDHPTTPSGEIFGYYVLAKQYFERYHLPIMHTETNRKDVAEAPAWLWKEWSNILRLRHDGVPILGFTWYSLIDQTDWDTALREDNHRINPLGLFDKHRRIRPVGKAYKELIAQWHDLLPSESLCREMMGE